MSKIKLGLMSPGTWGWNILKSAQYSDKIEIVVCSSRSKETAEKAGKEFNIRTVDSYNDLLNENVEGIILPTPNHLHCEQTLAAASAGKHILVEKPIANTLKEAKKMDDACKSAKVVLMVGHSQRKMPACRTAKRLIDSNKYGLPINAIACLGMQGVKMYGLGHWLLDGKLNLGGSLYMMGVHAADTLQYIIGPIKNISGFEIRNLMGTSIPEVASGIFEFKEKRLGYLSSYYIAPYNSFIEIYCEKGIFYIGKFGRELYIQNSVFPNIDRKKISLDPTTPYKDPVHEELDEFADCISGKREPETGAKEAMDALAAVRGIMISADEKRIVSIEEILEKY
jgi:predicted dehydrogenase